MRVVRTRCRRGRAACPRRPRPSAGSGPRRRRAGRSRASRRGPWRSRRRPRWRAAPRRRRPGRERCGSRRRRCRGADAPATSSGSRSSSRPMSAAIAPSRPPPEACISRPRSRTRRTPSSSEIAPGRDERGVLAHRVPGREGRLGRGEPGGRPPLAHRGRGSRSTSARSAGWAFSVRSSCSAGPSQASAVRGSPRAASAVGEDRGRAGETSARARPIPTDCEPWPGKTKANVDIVVKGSARTAPNRADSHARLHGSRRRPTLPHVADPSPSTRRHPVPRRAVARHFEADLSAPVLAAGNRLPNVRQISERVAMGRALWRELVIGFAEPARGAAARVHPARGPVRAGRRRAR